MSVLRVFLVDIPVKFRSGGKDKLMTDIQGKDDFYRILPANIWEFDGSDLLKQALK